MVRLSAAQERLIDQLKEKKAAHDKQIIIVDAQTKLTKQGLREPLVALVKEALDAGIPARQIAQRGLGYAEVSSLRTYILPALDKVGGATTVSTIQKSVGDYPVTVTQAANGNSSLTITDSFGNTLPEKVTFYYSDPNAEPEIYIQPIEGTYSDIKKIKDAIEDFFVTNYLDYDAIWRKI